MALKKSELCEVIYTEEKAKANDNTLRSRGIARIVAELGMTPAGASTYFSNAKNKVEGLTPGEKVVKAAVKMLSKIDAKGTESDEVFSMVTLDAHKKAVDVKCFISKQSCLEECNAKNKHFVRGLQKLGAKLGTLDDSWMQEVDAELVAQLIAG